jgi:hypothetical protein
MRIGAAPQVQIAVFLWAINGQCGLHGYIVQTAVVI